MSVDVVEGEGVHGPRAAAWKITTSHRGIVVMTTTSTDGFETSPGWIARALGRHVHRRGGYVLSVPAARLALALLVNGWTADVPVFGGAATFTDPAGREHNRSAARRALLPRPTKPPPT